MTARIPLPIELASHPFSLQDALDQGIKLGRLRGRDLARPFPGVRTTGVAESAPERARTYAAKMRPSTFFSHATAAQLWGIPLPLPLQLTRSLDVAVPAHHVIPGGRNVIGHGLMIDQADVVFLSGIRLTSLARTWCDLATLLTEEDLIAAGDFLLWRRRPPSLRLIKAELADALSRFHGRRGRPLLRATLPFLTDRSDSRPESAFRVRIRHAGLPAPCVNREIYAESGEFLAMPDLSFPAFKVSFDYEGDHHRTDPRQWEKDIARVPRLEDAGWLHLRGAKADYRNSDDLIRRLIRRLRRQGWQG